MSDQRITIRHHALRIAGSLLVRLPFTATGPYVFSSIERRSPFPDMPLKCAALALLCIPPMPSSFTDPHPAGALICRIVLLAGEYVDQSRFFSVDASTSPRGNATPESALDLIAISMMILCVPSAETCVSIEELMQDKIESLLTLPANSPQSLEICRRAMNSDFPSLGGDSFISNLATVAMEASLKNEEIYLSMQQQQQLDHVPTPREQSGIPALPTISDSPRRPILVSGSGTSRSSDSYGTAYTDRSTENCSTDGSLYDSKVCSIRVPKMSMHIQIPPSPSPSSLHESYGLSMRSERENSNRDVTSSESSRATVYSAYSDSYRPSWTPTSDAGIGFNSPVVRTANSIHPEGNAEVDSNWVDRTKLTSIKKGRKPGSSRFRARTADEIQCQSDEWSKGDIVNMPATAGARMVTMGEDEVNTQIMTPTESAASSGVGFKTPKEIGIYSTDGHREQQLEAGAGRLPLHPGAGNRRRSRSSTEAIKLNPFVSTDITASPTPQLDTTNLIKSASTDNHDCDNEVSVHAARKSGSITERKVNFSSSQLDSMQIFGSSPFGDSDVSVSTTESRTNTRKSTIPKQQRRRPMEESSPLQHNLEKEPVVIEQERQHQHHVVPDQNGLASSQDVFEYLNVEDIKPCLKPQRDINSASANLLQSDWPDVFHNINIVRQLAVHHSSLLIQSNQLHAIVLGLNKQVLKINT
jgi:hypothetical protein